MQFKRRCELKRTRVEIIPMIDTIFFLLVFFMLSSLALTKLNGFQVNLPQTQTAPRQTASELTLTIDKNRRLFLNREAVQETDLQKVLVQKAGKNLQNATLILNADESVPHGIVVRCIDRAREIGITHFAIATRDSTSNN